MNKVLFVILFLSFVNVSCTEVAAMKRQEYYRNYEYGADYYENYNNNKKNYDSSNEVYKSDKKQEKPIKRDTTNDIKSISKDVKNDNEPISKDVKNEIDIEKISDYKIYDMVGRQSYICRNQKELRRERTNKTFRHIDNFNGMYVSAGMDYSQVSLDTDLSISDTRYDNSTGQNNISVFDTNETGSHDSGSKMLGYFALGTGRVFSNNMYVGQEFNIQIGRLAAGWNEDNVNLTQTDNNLTYNSNYDYNEASFAVENLSSYTAKLGYLLYKRAVVFGAVGIGIPSTILSLKNADTQDAKTGGPEGPVIKVGFGVDYSLVKNVRILLEFNMWILPDSDVRMYQRTSNAANNTNDNIQSDFAVSGMVQTIKLGLIWKF